MRPVGYGLVVAVCLGGVAQADVITQSVGLGPVDSYTGEAIGHFADFNPQQGTLTGVSVSISYSSFASFTLQGVTPGQTVGVFEPLVSLIMPGTNPSVPVPTPVELPLVFFPDVPPTATTSFSVSDSAVINAANVASFVSPFGFLEDLELYVGFSVAPNQPFEEVGTDSGHSFRTGGEATITYTYDPTPVPEPASIVVLGLGALGVAAVARRRAR